MRTIQKPEAGEYAPYTTMYMNLLPEDGRVLDHLQENWQTIKALIGPLTEEKAGTPFAEGEWTVKEILTHIMDTERVFLYRALCISRNDATIFPGFDQDAYIDNIQINDLPLADLLEEYESMRKATLAFFKNVPETALTRKGSANGNPLSVRAAAWIIAGHELHHVNSIRENYL